MESAPLEILVIEDNPGDLLLITQYLKLSKVRLSNILEAATLKDAVALLQKEKPDLIFLDLFLPDSTAGVTFEVINKAAPKAPIVILSGLFDSDVALKAIQSGAQDYLIKGEFDEKMLAKTIFYSIERKKIQESLNNSLERHNLISLAANDVIWEWDLVNRKILYLSHAIETNFGYPAGEPDDSMRWWHEKIHKDDIKGLIRKFKSAIENKDAKCSHEFRFLARSGDYLLVLGRALIIYNEHNNAERLIGVLQDITTLKKVEEKLLWSIEKYEAISKATSDVIFEWDIVADHVVYREDAIEKLFGYRDEEVSQSSWWYSKLHPSDKTNIDKQLTKVLEQKSTQFSIEYRMRCADGSYKYIYSRAFIYYGVDGNPYRIIGALQDITELKVLQEKVLKEKIVMQQKITEATIQSQENEKEEIGKELHDNINQILATTKMFIDLSLKSPEKAAVLLPKSFGYLELAIEEIRKLSRSLVPPAMDDMGLDEAIREMIELASISSEVKYNFVNQDLSGANISSKIQLMVYRIVQEQLNNISKYAKATEVHIRLMVKKKILQVSINDNGIGFNMAKKSNGIGLRNIKSRAEVHGGTVRIMSSPGNGCTLQIFIPLKGKNNA